MKFYKLLLLRAYFFYLEQFVYYDEQLFIVIEMIEHYKVIKQNAARKNEKQNKI